MSTVASQVACEHGVDVNVNVNVLYLYSPLQQPFGEPKCFTIKGVKTMRDNKTIKAMKNNRIKYNK